VLIAPVVPFGFYPVFQGYPGSQHLSADTFVRLLTELVERLFDQARRLAILNTGVSTDRADAGAHGTGQTRLRQGTRPRRICRTCRHAGRGPGCRFSETGAFGDPTRASADKGRAYLDAMIGDLVDGLVVLYPDLARPR
jgi:creatinine amidohydrolase/Fe(II)-dependent formamide hydrolase-like protein